MKYLLITLISFAMTNTTALGASKRDDPICNPKYERSQRPPAEVTDNIKHMLCQKQWEVSDVSKEHYLQHDTFIEVCMKDNELDHKVPICLHGKTVLDNLMLQPWPLAKKWDGIEAKYCKMYCNNGIELKPAQEYFLKNK